MRQNISTKIIPLTLFGLVCLIPSLKLFFYNEKRIAEIGLILLTFIVLSASRTVQQSCITILSSLGKTAQILLFLLMSLGVVSASLSPVPQQAFIEVITLFSLLLIALLCAPEWKQLTHLAPYLILIFLASILIQEVRFLGYYCAFLVTGDMFSFHDFFSNFANPRFFNQYQIWTMPLLTIFLLIKLPYPFYNKTRFQCLLWVTTTIWWVMFFTTNGRGVILATITSFILTFIAFRHRTKQFLKLTGALFIIGFASYQLLFHLTPYLTGHVVFSDRLLQSNISNAARTSYLWPKAIHFMLDNPILGIGPMHYAWFPNKVAAHPHNSVLQIGAEWGIPALIICLLLTYRAVKAWVLKFNQGNPNYCNKNLSLLATALSFSVCSASIYSLFSGVIVMPMSQVTGSLIISLAFGIHLNINLPKQVKTITAQRSLAVTFTLLTLTYYWLLYPSLTQQSSDFNMPQNRVSETHHPRFWLNGDLFHKL